MTNPKSPNRPNSEAVYDQRTALVRDQMAKESAAQDAKTVRLKALRLEKEAAEAAEAAAAPPPAPVKKARARKKT